MPRQTTRRRAEPTGPGWLLVATWPALIVLNAIGSYWFNVTEVFPWWVSIPAALVSLTALAHLSRKEVVGSIFAAIGSYLRNKGP